MPDEGVVRTCRSRGGLITESASTVGGRCKKNEVRRAHDKTRLARYIDNVVSPHPDVPRTILVETRRANVGERVGWPLQG